MNKYHLLKQVRLISIKISNNNVYDIFSQMNSEFSTHLFYATQIISKFF